MTIRILCVLGLFIICGCDKSNAPRAANNSAYPGYDEYGNVEETKIAFRDDVVGQPKPDVALIDLEVKTRDGKSEVLREFIKNGNLVVVVTRGSTAYVCPYCSTQTSRLIANYDAIKARGAEVVVIYPSKNATDASRVPEFLAKVNALYSRAAAAPPPFPFVIDEGLKVVDALGIRKDLSKPATYILDSTGAIRFAYVGETLADRPSIKSLLQQLDALKSDAPEKPASTGG